jgi:hypothetical protein
MVDAYERWGQVEQRSDGSYAWLGTTECYIRLYAILLSIMTLVSLRNVIQCRRSWQPYGQNGSAIFPASFAKVFARILSSARCGKSFLVIY